MTAAKLVGLRALSRPEDVAPYFRFGADYLLEVADDMGWEYGSLDETAERAYESMRDGETDVPEDVERLIAAVLVADAEYWWPIGRWLPRGYALLMRGLSHALRRKLLKLAGVYTETLEDVSGFGSVFDEFYHAYPTVRERLGTPGYSNPRDCIVEGQPATAHVRGLSLDAFARRTVLGDSVLHVEWYEYVAEETGVEYDADLCAQTKRESPAYFAGVTDELSDDVRELQLAMFTDDDWIRRFHDEYSLRSVLFMRAADGIERTARELGQPTEK
ncbi:MAG: hypothetical protein U5J64_04135 [Halobacteriales archaeon]|nr:hypothetical protein [Halobacteriales archaeon]